MSAKSGGSSRAAVLLAATVLVATAAPRDQRLSAASGALAHPGPTQASPGAASEVRRHLLLMDAHTAARVGELALQTDREDPELRAWWVLAEARAGRASAALAFAEEFVRDEPESPWAQFALGAARMEHREHWQDAPESTRRAWDELGTDDAAWLHAQALITADRYAEAVAFLDDEWPGSEQAPRRLRQKSRALYYMGTRGDRDPHKLAEAIELARQAHEATPDSAAVAYHYGVLLGIQGDREAGYTALERAVQLSPASIPIRQQMWGALRRRTDLDPAGKLAMLQEQIADLVSHQGGSAASLSAAHAALEGLPEAEEAREALAGRLLAEFPASAETEWILVQRYRALSESVFPPPTDESAEFSPDPDTLQAYRQALREFLAREYFHRPVLRGDAYRQLYSAASFEPRPGPDELLEIIDGMVAWEGINPHISHAGGAIALAERTTYYERAEAIARAGFDAGRRKVEEQRSAYATQAEFDENMDWMIGTMHDALGWVYFQSDRVDEALVELEKAHDLDPDNLTNLHHLGQVYEYEGDRRRAERFYVLGLNVDRPGVNPNRAALEALYEADHGSLEGFDEYLAEIAEVDAKARHAEILASRVDTPAPPPAFELESLSGDAVSLDDLNGKIVVINFWGIWCYWCIIEMPEMQELHERYAHDPEVLILTINNDPDPDQVPGWMSDNEYTFPVLFDDGYVDGGARIRVFPTTWFLDSQGRIAFSKEGWSQDLVQEYTWRIEALRRKER